MTRSSMTLFPSTPPPLVSDVETGVEADLSVDAGQEQLSDCQPVEAAGLVKAVGLVESLRQQICAVETESRHADAELVSSGCPSLDRLLPEGGFVPGTLVEWFDQGGASGAGLVALRVALATCRCRTGALVVLDSQRQFYPPAALALGVDPADLIILRPTSRQDLLWATDQALRCPGVAAVWGRLDSLDERSFRRFQLAAEASGCLGLLLRPESARGLPSWSEIQLGVRSQPHRLATAAAEQSLADTAPLASPRFPNRRLQIELLRCRGAHRGHQVELEINEATGALQDSTRQDPTRQDSTRQDVVAATHDGKLKHETHPFSLASQLAHPKVSRRTARA